MKNANSFLLPLSTSYASILIPMIMFDSEIKTNKKVGISMIIYIRLYLRSRRYEV